MNLRRVLVVIAVLAAVRVFYVHEHTWYVGPFPPAVTPKVEYADRDYHDPHRQSRIEPNFVRVGTTMGGGDIYAPRGPRTTTVINVVDDGRVFAYDLMGGP